MENNKLFKAVERSTQDIPITLDRGNSERWTIQSQKTKYVNDKMSGVIGELQPKTYIEIKIISQL